VSSYGIGIIILLKTCTKSVRKKTADIS